MRSGGLTTSGALARKTPLAQLTSPSSVAPAAALTFTHRSVVQSGGSGNLRSPLDAYADRQLVQRLRANANGNYYRYQQRLWPSEEALEIALTGTMYSSVERTPLQLMPTPRKAPRRVAAFEGSGAVALLERAEQAEEEEHAVEAEQGKALAPAQDATQAGVDSPLTEDSLLALQLQASAPVSQKVITEGDIEGSVLASARERARQAILNDLAHNELLPSRDAKTGSLSVAAAGTSPSSLQLSRPLPSARDAAPGTTWASLGLDPLLAEVVVEKYGPAPSRLQSRLLPALLHEDHNDVLFNGVTGSGKTTALLLALMQGVRSESAGMNIFVATNTMTAMRFYDAIRALCRCRGVGGALVDRPVHDFSWLVLGTYREDYEKYYQLLRRGLRGPHGPARVFITTADVMCELLFEKKMEFRDFGYLRRVYLDDVGAQMPMVPDDAPVAQMRERLRNPTAAELLLGTLHQLPGPHIRSVLQLGMVSADLDGDLKDHLTSLCLKPTAHTTVLSPVRLPSTVHCLFSFFLQHEDRWAHVVRLIWNARATIPGRAILFVHDDVDLLQVRSKLRGFGMDAKLFSEVYANGQFQDEWKFLLLKASEAFGLDIPLVSHVFITFAPSDWRSYQHMCGRTGRLGNVGWVYTIADRREAKHLRRIAGDLDVDFVNHVVDVNLGNVPSAEMERLTKPPTPYGLDPQYAVQQHYEVQTESPDAAYREREFFTRPNVNRQFQMENYTPIPEQQRRFDSARLLARDVERDPRRVAELVKKGLLDENMKPTTKLRRRLNSKSSKFAPSTLDG